MLDKALVLLFLLTAQTIRGQFSPSQPDLPVTEQQKKQIIDTIVRKLSEAYVSAPVGKKVAATISAFRMKGAYKHIRGSKELADSLTQQLTRISNDKHLQVLFSYDKVPPPSDKEPPLPEFIRRFAIDNNYGFNKTDTLEGNIGYMNILGFFPFEEATREAIRSFERLANTRALIIDLRQNSGGLGDLANFVISYLFEGKPVHLLDVTFRKDNRLFQSWSSYYVPGKRYLNKPVYVLTSSATFSAGEAFAGMIQALKRGVVIGETTGGGANMGELVRINDHFVVNLPTGKPLIPGTTRNWEGTGIQPDIRVPKEQAVSTAHRAALQALVHSAPDEEDKEQLQKILQQLFPGQ